MLRQYLKSQLGVLLAGGLVGPIFLAVYFATGFGDELKWMFYTGLLVTAADVLIALALTNSGMKSAAKTDVLERDGVLALASITGIGETAVRVNDEPVVKLRLHISGPGFTAFDRETRVIAGVARQVAITARKLVVLVDPTTLDYDIDWERSALVNGLLPAQFTLDEDQRTYDLTGQAGPLLEILQILKANGVALNQMVDVRSNPLVRQQIAAVLRRTAEATPEAAGQAAPQPSIGERLQQLEALHRDGSLTDQEYASKRAQIIAEL